jgi:HEAT repeat protein
MKIGLPLKLGIGIVVVFGALLLGMALYWPLWYRVQGSRLESADAAVRETAIDALADKGKYAIPHIRKWLGYSSDARITGACRVLEKMENDLWENALVELERILDSAHSVKTDAVVMIFFLKKHGFRLDDDEEEILFNTYKANPLRQKNILLGILFKSTDEDFREAAIKTLVNKHKDTPGLFFHMKNVLCKDVSDRVRAYVTYALGEIDDPRAVEPLIGALESDSDLSVRWWAADALGEIGDPRALEPLIKVLENDSESVVRRRAVVVLGKIGDPRVVEPLIGALENDSDSIVRAWAADVLGEIGDPRALEPLIKVLENDSDSFVRKYAADSLGEIADLRALEPLIKALENDSYYDVRMEAADALGEIADTCALEPLIQALENDSYYTVRMCAAWALGEIGGLRALEPLIQALENDSYYTVRMCAASALGKIGDLCALEPLIKTLENDSNYDVRWCAADSLGEIGDPRAVEPLIKVLENNSDFILRSYAAVALGEIGDPRAIESLLTTLENDSDSNVRDWSAVALAGFECARVREALKAARSRKNKGAAIALAWQFGGDNIESAGRLKIEDLILQVFLVGARARWGDGNAVEEIIRNLPYLYYFLRCFHADVFSRMPAGFPEYDFKANYATRKKQAKAAWAWYEKNKARLAWDAKARKYFLRDRSK